MIKQIDYDFSSMNQILPAAVHKNTIKTFEHYVTIRFDFAVDTVAEVGTVGIDYYAGAVNGVMSEKSDNTTVNRIENGAPRWAIVKMDYQSAEINAPMLVARLTIDGLGQGDTVDKVYIDNVEVPFSLSIDSDTVIVTLETPSAFPDEIVVKIVRE